MSSIEVSTPTMKQDMSGMHVFQLVKRDHQIVNELFGMYQQASSLEEKQLIVYNIIRELSVHSASEEMTWYLKLEEKLGAKGKQYFDESVKEHQQLKEELEVLNQKKINDPEVQRQFETVMKDTLQHVKFEESSVLPDMEAAMNRDELAQLTEQWIKTKSMAPTRPHPMAGTPAPAVAATASALIDKTADLARFGMEKSKSYASEQSATTGSRPASSM